MSARIDIQNGIYSSPEISVTTPSRKTEDTSAKTTVISSGQQNVLNNYRSFNYNFTLAAVRKENVNDPSAYRDPKPLDLVILKSGGKGTTGISTNVSGVARTTDLNSEVKVDDDGNPLQVTTVNKQGEVDLVSGFNKNSPGRFDMFIDQVEIESLMTFTQDSNASLPTTIKFEVIEPYSINGFIESLHVSAVAAGYPTYSLASFVLKMEFIGHPDDMPVDNSTAVQIPNSTRYFIFGFTGIEVEVTERGTRYRCAGVPFNEKGFGQPNVLKKSTNGTGTTVKEILEDFINNIKIQVAESDKNSKEPAKATKHDEYAIKFPKWDPTLGFVDSPDGNEISKSDVVEILKGNAVYKFPDAGTSTQPDAYKADNTAQPSAQQQAADPDSIRLVAGSGNSKPTVQFTDGANIHECISSIIRDSNYVKNKLRNLKGSINEFGMLDYFLIKLEVTNLSDIDTESRKPYQKFTYVVTPYKIHYTRIPNYGAQHIDDAKLKQLSLREYNYIYTGKNIDVLNFKLNFNTLFFEAIPNALGNNDSLGAKHALAPSGAVTVIGKGTNMDDVVQDQNATSTKRVDAQPTSINPIGGKGGQVQDDPYSVLAINMHEAVINSKASMITGELEILGDPFFLVTGGIGNYNPIPDSSKTGVSTDGEALHNFSEVLITINFRNPIDISSFEEGGLMYFESKKVPFSGIYRVLKAVSTFKDGQFKQRLEILRVPGQVADTSIKVSEVTDQLQTAPDPDDQVVESTSRGFNPSSRPSTVNLLSQLGRGLPSSGLPGVLSNFTAAAGGLGGTVNSLLNQVSGAVSNGIGQITSAASIFGGSVPGGVDQLASGIRLSAAGLTSLVESKLAPAALIGQAANTIQSAFPISKVSASFAETINTKISSAAQLISVAGSGIGQGATVLINSIPSITPSKSFGTTAGTDLLSQTAALPTNISAVVGLANSLGTTALASVAGVGDSAANLVNGIGSKISTLSSTLSTDPTNLAGKLGINVSQLSGLSANLQSKILDQASALAKQIPDNVDLSAVSAQGIVLDYVASSSLANLPASLPYTTAPNPAIDTAFFNEIVGKGGNQALANAYGVTDVSKISSNLLSTSGVNQILASAAAAISNPLGGTLGGITKQVNITDVTALGGKLLSAESQLSVITGNVKSLEANLNSAKSIVGSAINSGGNLTSSVTSKFGSLSKGTSPLDKLMIGSGGG